MERNEILKPYLKDMPSLAIVANELNRIEAFANSDLIPYDKFALNDYTKVGIIIIKGTIEEDRYAIFIKARLPEGWKKQLNKEKGWRIDLIDAKGRLRGYFKYKPSDRATAYILNRFEIDSDYDLPIFQDDDYHLDVAAKAVLDNLTGEFIYKTGLVDEGEFCKSRDKADEIATTWLNKNYPDWRSPVAYWD